jgi:hypothetical protein
LIELSIKKSNNIIKKGDHFNIYVNVTNGHEKEITIKEMRLFQPSGFIALGRRSKNIGAKLALLRPFAEFFGFKPALDYIYESLEGDVEYIKRTTIRSTEGSVGSSDSKDEVILGPFIKHPQETIIQPKGTYREDFNLKAGWPGGLRPRPDTYTISCEVVYECDNKISYKTEDIEVSIFPSMGSMLVGTLLGSVLGTIVKVLTGGSLFNRNVTIGDFKITPQSFSWSDVTGLIPLFFVNLILGLLIGIILMRKKDVQPFLTVEDFLGRHSTWFLSWIFGSSVFISVWKPSNSCTR